MTDGLLKELAQRGLMLESDGTDLRLLGPRDRMDPGLVAQIRAAKTELIRVLAPASGGPIGTAATPLQRSYLLGRQGAVGIGELASYVYHEFAGSWDLPKLEAALNAVVARHDSLRTHFTDDGRRVVDATATVTIGLEDLRDLRPDEQDLVLQRLRAEKSHRVLPVDRAPLLRVEATVLADDRMVLHVGHDGLVMDGISMFLFFRDWRCAYERGIGLDQQDLPSFDSYVEGLERGRLSAAATRSRGYWFDRLDQLPAAPELPLSRDPSSVSSQRFTSREIRLDAPLWDLLKGRAAREGVTPTAMLMAAYAETLSFWGADRQFTINTTIANRLPIHPGIAQSIGQFCDVLPVVADVDPERDFRGRTLTLQTQLRRDLDARHFPGVAVLQELQRRGGQAANLPYTFNSALGAVDATASGSALSAFGREIYTVSQTPQVWLNVFVMEQDGELVVQLDAVEDLYPDGLLDAFVAGYRRMLERLTDDATWSARTIDLLPADQRQRREDSNATAVDRPDELAHQRFLRHAQERPDALAVISTGAKLTYGELAQRVTRVAGWLRERGVGRDELVGLVMRRGPEQIIGILAVAMAGGAYLPVDADLPEQRQAYMLRDGGVRCALTNVPGRGWVDVDTLTVDLASPTTGPEIELEPTAGWTPDDLLYVLYTSGTTGDPKGVMVSHRSVCNLVADCNQRFAVGPSDRFFGISAFNFDLSVYDVFGALSAGAALVLPDADRAADPAHWLALCGQHRVTIWNSVPAIVAMLSDQGVLGGTADLATLRLIMMSGDRVPPALPRTVRRLGCGAALVSLGGPTETTVWNIFHPIEDADSGRDSIPYGRPNSNNRCYVLDERGRQRPDWVSGEICAAGMGLARGYWADEGRTEARFAEHRDLGERIYRTGDLGRYLPSGDVDILGRRDFQIKINGYRIEAGEVETRLAEISGVKQAAVVRQDGSFGSRLVAHLTGDGPRPQSGELREQLREFLPSYMVPSLFHWHDRLPLTGNGKVDRGALTRYQPESPYQPEQPSRSAEPAPVASTELERSVQQIWSDVLRVEIPSPTCSFYDVGGDSLAAARVLTRVRKSFGIAIALDQFYLVASVRAMAAEINRCRPAVQDRKLAHR